MNEENIRIRAYFRWQNRRPEDGDALTDWLAAEQEILAEGQVVSPAEPETVTNQAFPATMTAAENPVQPPVGKPIDRQQEVRNAVRMIWSELLEIAVGSALAAAQEKMCADRFFARLWPSMPLELVLALDRADPSELLSCDAVPAEFEEVLVRHLAEVFAAHQPKGLATNPHAREAKLIRILSGDVEHNRDSIKRQVYQFFERKGTDRISDPRNVRALVFQRLADASLDECTAIANGGNEARARWHLKLLTLLTTGDPADRGSRIEQLRDGKTRSFPYVARFLQRGTLPAAPRFKGDLTPNFEGFSPEIIATFPDAAAIRDLYDGYVQHRGILGHWLPVDRPPSAEIAEDFAKIPDFSTMSKGGIVLPTAASLHAHRAAMHRIPDGVVCAFALAVMIEWSMHQAAAVAGLQAPASLRGHELVARLTEPLRLSHLTRADLDVVFTRKGLNLRDALVHGAFFADQQHALERTLHGLARTLARLVTDLRTTGILTKFPTTATWDSSTSVDPKVDALISTQTQPGLSLLNVFGVEEGRKHVFETLSRLMPDKAMLGKGSFLLWVDERDKTAQRSHELVALISSLITLEELFRAVCEEKGLPTLIIASSAPDAAKCELAILDSQQGKLLEPKRLQMLFSGTAADVGFRDSLDAIKQVRDRVAHGTWRAFRSPWMTATELVLKLAFALCTVLDS
ncbi:MAG: DUF2934 domain-containing protein [Myxococcales bacterium]|nr:DUF2934 domain-containing protein [Myxococcales bacterium]